MLGVGLRAPRGPAASTRPSVVAAAAHPARPASRGASPGRPPRPPHAAAVADVADAPAQANRAARPPLPEFPWPERGPKDVPRLVPAAPPEAGAGAQPPQQQQPPQPAADRRRRRRRRGQQRPKQARQLKAAVQQQEQPSRSPQQGRQQQQAAGQMGASGRGGRQQRQQPGVQPSTAQALGAASAAAATAAAAAAPAAAAAEGGARAAKRRAVSPRVQRAIALREEGLLRWYVDAVQAAEKEHARMAADGAAGDSAAATLGQALSRAAQAWLDPRLDDVGFESRPFPPLAPVPLPGAAGDGWRTLAYTRRLRLRGGSTDEESDSEYAASGAAGATSSSVTGSDEAGDGEEIHMGGGGRQEEDGSGEEKEKRQSTSHAFVEWALEEQRLPLLASQWAHGAHSWEPAAAGAWLHEGHAAHEWAGAAEEHARAAAELYEAFARDALALPAVAGRRPARGALAGAAATFTVEALLPGGGALQVGASHFLADNYSRALGAALVSWDGSKDYIHQMACVLPAGALTAAAIVHGDGAGLVLPPEVAPVQVSIVPILRGGSRCDRAALAAEADRVASALAAAGVRAAVDGRSCVPGVKFGSSERRGVPLRIEFDPEGAASRTCTLSRRDAPGAVSKLRGVSSEAGPLAAAVAEALEDAQSALRWRSEAALQSEVVDVSSYFELKDAIARGKWARGPWAGSEDDEAAVLADTGAELICIPLAQPVSVSAGWSTCLYSGYQATEVAIFARRGP